MQPFQIKRRNTDKLLYKRIAPILSPNLRGRCCWHTLRATSLKYYSITPGEILSVWARAFHRCVVWIELLTSTVLLHWIVVSRMLFLCVTGKRSTWNKHRQAVPSSFSIFVPSLCLLPTSYALLSIHSLYACQGVWGITFICNIPRVLAFCHVVWPMPETEEEMPPPWLGKQGMY